MADCPIIIAAVFVYKISVKTGSLTLFARQFCRYPDQRLQQMLIVGFCRRVPEGVRSGFGAPVAINRRAGGSGL